MGRSSACSCACVVAKLGVFIADDAAQFRLAHQIYRCSDVGCLIDAVEVGR